MKKSILMLGVAFLSIISCNEKKEEKAIENQPIETNTQTTDKESTKIKVSRDGVEYTDDKTKIEVSKDGAEITKD